MKNNDFRYIILQAALNYKSSRSEMDSYSTVPLSQDESNLNVPPTSPITGDLEAGATIGWSPPDNLVEGSRTLSAATGESNSSCAAVPADIDYFLQVVM